MKNINIEYSLLNLFTHTFWDRIGCFAQEDYIIFNDMLNLNRHRRFHQYILEA